MTLPCELILQLKKSISLKNQKKAISLESRIIALLQLGLSNRDISKELGLSINTVKYHLKKIYKKLIVKNRIEAINKFNESSK